MKKKLKKETSKTIINNQNTIESMKMKLKSLFMLAAAVFAFAACSNDDVLPEGGNEDGGSVEEAWLSLNVSFPASTRDLNTPDQENATADESDIKTLKAIFFTGFDQSSTVTNVIDLLTHTSSGGTVAEKPFKLSKEAKSFLVVANAPSDFAPTVGQSYASVNAARTETASKLTDAASGFMMTNAKGDLEPSTAAGANKNLTLYSSSAEAMQTANIITVALDRVVSKVRLYLTGGAVSTDRDVAINNVGWILNVTNKKYYPVSKRTKTQYELNNPTYKVWSDPYGLGSYRVDPNYEHTAGNGLKWNDAEYDNNYSYYTETNVPTWVSPTNATTAPGDDQEPGNPKNPSLFCLENTQIAADNLHAYTTHALVKATYLPNKYEVATGGTTTVQEPGLGDASNTGKNDWMMIDGGYYTYATLLGWIEKELTTYYSGSGHTKNLTDAFNGYLTDLSLTVTLTDIADVLNGTVTAADAVSNAIAAFTGEKANVLGHANKAGVHGAVSYYTNNGLCYYKIPIKHANKDDLNNQLGEFGCVRNSVYDIYISKFNNPGYPVIPKPDPNTPDEEDFFLAVQIIVNPWTWYTQTEEL